MADQPTTAKEILETLARSVSPEKLGDLNAVVEFDLAGTGGGMWHVQVANQRLAVFDGPADGPALSLSMPASDFALLTQGKLNPMSEFMTGNIKLKGDMALAMRMLGLLRAG